jgi:short-subunit dehydrogenase
VLLVSPSTTESEFFGTAGAAKSPRGMSTETVARRIVVAMHRGRREIILSAGGKLLVWLDRMCPPLADWVICRWG